MDLFEYPFSPGFKRRETAAEAAEAILPKANQLQRLCLDVLAQHGPLTADECADILRIDKLSIRPRFSELAARNQVVDTGERRFNASGKRAVVWGLPPMAWAA